MFSDLKILKYIFMQWDLNMRQRQVDGISGELRLHFALPSQEANVVADALNWKSRGVLASVASRKWQMLEDVRQFGLHYKR